MENSMIDGLESKNIEFSSW